MALATTCPQCKTSFKVVPDQLKLRKGLVRCGVCQHVFSGIDYLRYVDDAARTAQRIARERAAAGATPASQASDGSTPPRTPASITRPMISPGAAPAPSPAPLQPVPGMTRPEADAPVATSPAGTDESQRVAPTAAEGSPDPWAPSPVPATVAALPAVEAPVTEPTGRADLFQPPLPPPIEADAPERVAFERTSAPPEADSPSPAFPLPGRPADLPGVVADRSSGFPALPAPRVAERPEPFSLEHLTPRSRPLWPSSSEPQTIIGTEEDLKTAFFLPDTTFGPMATEPRDFATTASLPITAEDTPADAASGMPASHTSSPHTAILDTSLPGLPLRPEGPPTQLFDEDGGPVHRLIERPAVGGSVEPLAPRSFAPEAAIEYFPGSRTRSRSLGLALSPSAWIVAAALAILLALQALVGWRDGIAARVPLVAPTIAALLAPFGLSIGPPRDIDALTIESFELQTAAAPNVLQLSAVLRNRSGHVVGYPAMELMLTDSAGGLLVRKVIPADAYLADTTVMSEGLAPRSERPIRLALEHGGLQPSGYAVALFYP